MKFFISITLLFLCRILALMKRYGFGFLCITTYSVEVYMGHKAHAPYINSMKCSTKSCFELFKRNSMLKQIANSHLKSWKPESLTEYSKVTKRIRTAINRDSRE